MTFDEILAQIINLLKRQRRVSFRALKRRFDIDDDYIEDLKEEILYVHPVIDDEGKGLMWTGDTARAHEDAAPSAQTTPPPTAQEEPPTQVASPRPEPRTPEAERRQLTVMFVDMVGSTELSSQLDPEDYREVVREYQKACTEVIERFDGYVAQYLGDGLLVYFGYPQSHEDEAQRAVYTGLGMLNGMKQLNARLEQDKAIHLALRVGLHTGLVVIGEIGEGSRQEQLALGEVPNVTARIQGLAEPDTVVISDATYRLVQGFFDCESLGEHELRGVTEPIAVYRILRASGVQSRLDVASTRGLTPLVGRESEVTILLERWNQVEDGQGQVVLLSGEAGIGKSRLVQILKDHVADTPHTRLECRSSPYFTNSALYPLIDMMQRTLRFQSDETPEQKLEKLVQNLSQYRLPLEETVPLFGALLSLLVPEDRYPPLNFTPQRQRQKTLETILATMLELSERQPVLFILEDLHWTDPTTLAFIEWLIDQTPTTAIYALLTCRPEFQPSWSHRSYLTEVTLNRLSRTQVESMVQQVTGGKGLPAELLKQIIEKTDGVPLFVEEMTKAVLESGIVKEMDERYELMGQFSSLSIPSTLQDSLMARLDRLVTAKGVAQYGAVIGRQFSYSLLQAASQLDNAVLDKELGLLVNAELVYQRGLPPQASYTFKHALIQDTAYASLLRSIRQQYHQRIAQTLEERFPETTEAQPEILAHHFTEAGSGFTEQAIAYWHQAGEKAERRSAHAEAISHLTTGLELLKTIPTSPKCIQQELALQTLLGSALVATKGYASLEVEQAYARARVLCHQVSDAPQLDSVLMGLYLYYINRPDFQISFELGEQFLRLAHQAEESVLILQAHMMLGVPLFWCGQLTEARHHLEQSIALYGSQYYDMAFRYGQDSGVVCRHYAGWVLWFLGYPEKSRMMCDTLLTLAQELSHPLSSVYALSTAASIYLLLREGYTAQQLSEEALALATEHNFTYWIASSMLRRGEALAIQGHYAEGISQLQQGLTARLATGAQMARSLHDARLAYGYGQMGQPEEGLSKVTEALSIINNTGERSYEAELHRIRGELLLQKSLDNRAEAETCFQQALDIVRRQQAKSLELRAATSLARLWQSQDKRQEAYDLLAPVYGWFTEGFDTADLIDAKQLLDALN
jgi:class 3 adenylate cyclase/predicted ATPase